MAQEKTLRRALLFAACALVFFFAWHAKTAGYSHASLAKVMPSSAAKLWMSGQKMGVPPANLAFVPLLWAAILGLFSLQLQDERRLRLVVTTLPSNPRNLQRLYRVLRPPPAAPRNFSH